jgi:hypothetical protein
LEQLKSYKYLGATVDGINSMEEESKERITLDNKAYYANQKYLKAI